MIGLEKLQTANWYMQDTNEKVITVNATQFHEIIEALEEAKKIMKNNVELHDSKYDVPYEEDKWLKKYFGENK